MPALGKETERQLTPDEIAQKEIEGYIDRVEKQVENQQQQQNKPQPQQMVVQNAQPQPIQNIATLVPVITKPKIVLPLDQVEVEGGLKRGVVDSFRWLAEWCVMMIKKYPGRVFYMPHQTNK